jgi:outer membrane protein assembly factor BamB
MRVAGEACTITCGATALARTLAVRLTAAALLAVVPAPAQAQPGTPSPLIPLKSTWHADLEAEPVAALTMDAERIYVVLGTGKVSARARADGHEVWAAALDTRQAAVSDGARVYVASGDRLHALRVRDGSAAWTATLGGPAGWFVSVAGWIVAGTDRDLVALRATDGSEVWRRSLAAALAAAPEIEGTRVYAALADGRVVALRIETGEPVWTRALPGTPGGMLALPDRLYVGASDNFLYALAPRDGTVLWRWRTAADVIGRPAADERHVYFLSFDNVLRALDRRTGAQRWRRPMGVRYLAGPQAAAGLIVVPVRLGQLYFYAAATGGVAADLQLPAPMAVAPAGLDSAGPATRVYIATMDSNGAAQIHAFEPGGDAPLAPLGALPGQPLWPEIRLASRPTPVSWLVLPAPRPRAW